MNSYRLAVCDHYLSPPIRGLDVTYSEFRGSDIRQVPVIRIFGPSQDGKKSCLHIHGVFPYLFVPYEGSESPDKLKYLIASSLDKMINISLGQTNSLIQHVYKITLVSGTPFYGYHQNEHQFFKIYLYNPNLIKRAAELLQNGSIMNTVYQPHESHIPFQQQFMIDFNLQGMNMVNCRKVSPRAEVGELVSSWDLFSDHQTAQVKTPLKVSTCEVEVDVMAVDILNRHEISDGGVNPGLASLWDDECARRRANGRHTQPTPQTSQTRSVLPTPEEELYRATLQEKIQQLSQNVLNASSSGDSVPYPIEAPQGMLNASFVDPHTPLRTIHTPDLDTSEPSTSTQLMDTQDAELLEVLYEMAETQEEEEEDTEKDQILGSQRALQLTEDQKEEEYLESLEMSQPFLLDTSFNKSEDEDPTIEDTAPLSANCSQSSSHSSTFQNVQISSPSFLNVSEILASPNLQQSGNTSSDNEVIECSPDRVAIAPPSFLNVPELETHQSQTIELTESENSNSNPAQDQNSTKILSQNTIEMNELMSETQNFSRTNLLMCHTFNKNSSQDKANIEDCDSEPDDVETTKIDDSDDNGIQDSSISQSQPSERSRSENMLRAEDEELLGLLDQISQFDGTDDEIVPQKGRRLGTRGRYIPRPSQPFPSDNISGSDTQTQFSGIQNCSVSSTISSPSHHNSQYSMLMEVIGSGNENSESQNLTNFQPQAENLQSSNHNSTLPDTLILTQTESETESLTQNYENEYNSNLTQIVEYLKANPTPSLFTQFLSTESSNNEIPPLDIGLNSQSAPENVETGINFENVDSESSLGLVAVSTLSNELTNRLNVESNISENSATVLNFMPTIPETSTLNTQPQSMSDALITRLCNTLTWPEGECESNLSDLELSDGQAAMSLLEEEGLFDLPTTSRRTSVTKKIRTTKKNTKLSLRSFESRSTYVPVNPPAVSVRNEEPTTHNACSVPIVSMTTESDDHQKSVVQFVPENTSSQSQVTLTSVYSNNRKRKSATSCKPKKQVLDLQLEIPHNKKSVFHLEINPRSAASKKMKITYSVEDSQSDSSSHESIAEPSSAPVTKRCSVALRRLSSEEIESHTNLPSTSNYDKQPVTYSSSLLDESNNCAVLIKKSTRKKQSDKKKRSHRKKSSSSTSKSTEKTPSKEKARALNFKSPNISKSSNNTNESVLSPESENNLSQNTSNIISSPEDFIILRRGRCVRRNSDEIWEHLPGRSKIGFNSKSSNQNSSKEKVIEKLGSPKTSERDSHNNQNTEDLVIDSPQEIPNSQEIINSPDNAPLATHDLIVRSVESTKSLPVPSQNESDSGGAFKRGRSKRRLMEDGNSDSDLSAIEFLENSQNSVHSVFSNTSPSQHMTNTKNITSKSDSDSDNEIIENSEDEREAVKSSQRSPSKLKKIQNFSSSTQTINKTQKTPSQNLNTSDIWEGNKIVVQDLKHSPLHQHIESQPPKNDTGSLKKGPDKLSSILEEGEEEEDYFDEGIISFYDTNETTVIENVFQVEPKMAPPSYQYILDSLSEFNLNEIKVQEPYYSVSSDVTNKNKEIGGKVRKLLSNSVRDLPEYQSEFTYQKSAPINLHELQDEILIEPLLAAPTAEQVLHYNKPASTTQHKSSKLKIIVPNSPGRDSDDDNRSMTLSPCSDTDSVHLTPVSQHKTPKAHSTPMPKALARCKTPRRSSTQSDSWCKIDGPSPLNNTFGFRVPSANLQNARALVQPQHLSVLEMECQVSTRGDLIADPDIDAVRAVFYLASCDDGRGTSESGVIVVTQPGEAPMLAGNKRPVTLTTVATEKNLFEKLVELVRKWDPDILVGYETEKSSWGYIIQRSAFFDMNFANLLSRVPKPDSAQHGAPAREQSSQGALTEFTEVRITGRILLNLWRLLRNEVALQSYVYENIAFHVLHERVPAYSARILTFWWEHPSGLHRWKVIDHWVRRVHGCSRIMDQLDLIGRNAELAKVFGIQFYEVFSRGSQFRVESMMLRLAKPRNFVPVSPSVLQRAHMRAPEFIPLILEPESMYYADPVIVLDFQSLYPSIIIAYNYCFSTCLGRVEHLGQDGAFDFGCTHLKVPPRLVGKLTPKLHVSPCGVAYVPKDVREGVLPCMLREILETRLMVKKSMKENKGDATLQRVLHARQLGLKLIANVTYGYTAANFSGRMPCIEVGDSVVSKGRETLDRAIHMVEERSSEWGGARVVYGDTDSMFVCIPGKSRKQAFEIGALIAEAVTQANPSPVKLKLEKVYQPCILQTKKRYVGFMYENADQETPVYEAKGIETVRRDGCPAVAKMLEKTLKILFETQDVSNVKKYVTNQFQKILLGRTNLQDLIFAKEFRGFSGYRPGACVPSLALARQWVSVDKRAEPLHSERVPYVIVSGAPGLPLIRLVRSPHELLKDPALRPNFEYYITRAIAPALDRCLSLIGADVMKWYSEMPRRTCHTLPLMSCTTGKSTISQYFATIECAACRQQQTREGLCEECRANPQRSALTLLTKIRKWERAVANIDKLCSNCCSYPTQSECSSLVCPILFRRVQANRDLQQVPFARQLLSKFFEF